MTEEMLVMKVYGMTCQGCANNTVNVLASVRGAKEAKVDLEKSRAAVVFDPNQVNEERLEKAITEAGCTVA